MRFLKSFIVPFVVFALLIGAPVEAQEAVVTLETDPGEAVPVVIVDESGDPVIEEDGFTVPAWLMQNIVLLTVALSAIFAIIQAVTNNRNLKQTLESTSKSQKDALESAHESLPESAQGLINRLITTVENGYVQIGAVIKFIKEITDGQPNTDPLDTGAQAVNIPRAGDPLGQSYDPASYGGAPGRSQVVPPSDPNNP